MSFIPETLYSNSANVSFVTNDIGRIRSIGANRNLSTRFIDFFYETVNTDDLRLAAIRQLPGDLSEKYIEFFYIANSVMPEHLRVTYNGHGVYFYNLQFDVNHVLIYMDQMDSINHLTTYTLQRCEASLLFNNAGQLLSITKSGANNTLIYSNLMPSLEGAEFWVILQSSATFRGFWNCTATYVAGDSVIYCGSGYLALNANSGSNPTTSSHWHHIETISKTATTSKTSYLSEHAMAFGALAVIILLLLIAMIAFLAKCHCF